MLCKERPLEDDRPSHLRAYLAAIAASILYISSGMVMGWSSPVLPKLNLTTSQESLVGSLYSLGAAPGFFIVTFGIDNIGRKGTLYVIWAFFMSSWIILASSQDLFVIYFGRLVGGLGLGAANGGICVYVAEIALPENRGRLGSLIHFIGGFGVLFVYGVGPYVSYLSLNLSCIVLTSAFGVLFYFAPESPYYFYKIGKIRKAKEALQKLRAYQTQEKLIEELAQIEKSILLQTVNSTSFLEAIRQPVAQKAIGLGIFIIAIQQFQGVNSIGAYNQLIFEEAKLSFPASQVPIIYFFAGTIFLLLPVFLVNKFFGVKTAYIVSGYGTSLTLALLGLYFYLINSGGVDMKDYSFISVVFLVAMSFFSHIGVAPLSWPLVAEILPLSVKGVGTGICCCISSLIGFVFMGAFPNVAQSFGYSTDFFGLAAMLIVSITVALFILPDTTGKTLQEIQEQFKK